MSNSFYDELEGLIGKHRQAEAEAEKSKQDEERFSRIEKGFDSLGKLIEERLPANSPQTENSDSGAENEGGNKPNASGDDSPSPTPEPELEVERISRFTVPKIYTGDDEPEIVKYIDAETGEEKTRRGRRKNRPTGYDVETVMEEVTEEAEQIPTEPNEASA
jgi:hypothetical protein